MSSADDLRTAIGADTTDFIEAAVANLVPCLTAEYVSMIVTTTLSFLFQGARADPVRRLAILNLIGDVREGWVNERGEILLSQYVSEDDRKIGLGFKLTPVFVVRPRGEATDA